MGYINDFGMVTGSYTDSSGNNVAFAGCAVRVISPGTSSGKLNGFLPPGGKRFTSEQSHLPLFISPQPDFVAKPGADADSWFWVANLETSRGTMNVLVHFLSVMAATEFVSEEQDFPIAQCSLATEKFEVISPIAPATGDSTTSHVTGAWQQAGVALDLTFTKTGPLLANAGSGCFPPLGDVNFHFAFPTMNATGTITIDGETLEATGPAWLDRQWGLAPRFFTPTPKKWIWFGIMLDNGDRLSVWDLIENDHGHAFATVVHPDGGHEVVNMEPAMPAAIQPWTSPETGNTYPANWDVRIPQLDARFTLAPDVLEQEFVSPRACTSTKRRARSPARCAASRSRAP